MIKRILVVNSYTYAGGSVVLSELCRQLSMLGYDARLFPVKWLQEKDSPNAFRKIDYLYSRCASFFSSITIRILPFRSLRTKLIPYDYYHPVHFRGCKIKRLPFFCKDSTLVVYPEKIYGNPLQAKKVVRWLLYHYKYLGDKGAYSASDMFVGYRDVFNNPSLNIQGGNVKVTTFDASLYRRYNFGARKGNCYIVRKGIERNDLPSCFDGPVIDDFSEDEKVRVFNECERCYSYDTQTFYSSIAAICGCISIVVMEPGREKNDYRNGADGPIYGVAYSEKQEEIDHAISTLPELIKSVDPTERNIDNVRYFVKIVEDYFNDSLLMHNKD